MSDGRSIAGAACIIPTGGLNTSAFDTPSASPRLASNPLSAVSATAMTTPSPKRSTASKKAEVIHRRGPWKSSEAVEFATLTWVDWFNDRQLLEPIGNIPPAEAEERCYAMQAEPAMAARLKQNGLRETRRGSKRL